MTTRTNKTNSLLFLLHCSQHLPSKTTWSNVINRDLWLVESGISRDILCSCCHSEPIRQAQGKLREESRSFATLPPKAGKAG